jgi:hypothetical protein
MNEKLDNFGLKPVNEPIDESIIEVPSFEELEILKETDFDEYIKWIDYIAKTKEEEHGEEDHLMKMAGEKVGDGLRDSKQ